MSCGSVKLEDYFNQPIHINYVYHNLIETNKPQLIKASINHIKLKEHSVDLLKEIKAIQKHFNTAITPELIQSALHPSRLHYSLSCRDSNDLDDVLDCY